MEILNYNKKKPNILHFQGKSDIMSDFFNTNIESLKDVDLSLPSNVTIITTFTDIDKSPLVAQLEKNNIPYINSFDIKYGLMFDMTKKVQYILGALEKVETEYCIILDGYDVLIVDFENIIERFHEYNTRMLFNASKNNYPVCTVDRMKERDYLGEYNHFNAGCAIGYTKDFIDFYKDCDAFMNAETYINPFNSEQFILRNVFAKYSESMLMPNPYISFDWKCSVFIALSHAYIVPTNEEETTFIAY